ncbi:hypothetical protein OVS_01265 [Mycoplasma ovis str. Michigan]|uniref:Recombinase RmuC n=1 Tax=Mycoplasma ovis str. Michigan TaxID=1415773 RepID=A0ABM5P138_9MOLU|nr:hypothetical protein [Mycoplasma ovis]AHC40187.1 hypothetical protein OVS_01265 [Mycoplasma ovis str. Michigan]
MLFLSENFVSYISLGLTCFLSLAVVTHLFVKQKEERRENKSRESEFHQKIEKLNAVIEELREKEIELLVNFRGDQQRLQQLEEESQHQLNDLEGYKQKLEEIEISHKELLIKSEGDNQRLKMLESSNAELLIKAENYYQKLQKLEDSNKDLSISVVEKTQKIQQLQEEKNNQLIEIEDNKKKIEVLEKINQQLLIESEGAKKLQEVSVNSSKFYEEFLSKGLDTNLDNLVQYQDFYREYFQKVEDWKLQIDLEKNRVRAGKIYEGNWGERISQLFNSGELDYIDLEEQPSCSRGEKADYKLVFRNSRNKQNSTNSIRIMIELKYSFGDMSLEQQFSNTKADLKKALEVAKYSSEPYHFIFLVTNREFEMEEYSKSETIWVVSDRDYRKFGLGLGRSEGEPIVAIMTPEASFRWSRMLYLLFWLAPTTRRVNVVNDEENFEKLDQKMADFIRECHNMTSEAEGVSLGIIKVVEKFLEDLDKKFKQIKNKLLKSEKALNNVKEKNVALWGEWKTLSLSFDDQDNLMALPTSEDQES